MKQFLFSYGTLQKEKVQKELFGRTLHGTKDQLRSHKIERIEITDEAFISKGQQKYQKTLKLSNDKNDSVDGTVFEVSEEELLIADRYEPINYKRMQVVLESGKQAWIYTTVETD
jgi:gamma-glutamylcyclotransferase (GGCT)/AIG2-like uncharacterized protein YtfP